MLEDLARSLYREWFVRFRFPGHQAGKVVDSELGPIPQGWTVTSLGNVCSLVRSGSTPRRSVARNWDGGVTPWFKTGELRDGPLTDSLEHVTTASGARLFEPDTILMAIYGSPTVGRLGWVTRRCSCNQAALAIRALDPDQEQDWIWYQLVALRGHFNSMAQGAAQQNISKEKVVETRVVLPPPAVRRAFADTAGATRRLWHALSHAKDALATTRDLLLPRLVTGRLDLSGIDLGDLLPSERA